MKTAAVAAMLPATAKATRASLMTLRSRQAQRTRTSAATIRTTAAVGFNHEGAAQSGKETNGSAQMGAPVSPVEPVSGAAMVSPNGVCNREVIAAACGSVSAAKNTKKPAAPFSALKLCCRLSRSAICRHPKTNAATPTKKMTKYAVSLVASIRATTRADQYR